MEVKLNDVKTAKTFKIAGIEFIKFLQEDNKVLAVTRDIQFKSIFGKNNNLSTSDVLKKLESDMLPKIEAAVGAENVLEFETDLFSLDGSRTYGIIKSKVALPIFDFYRNNRKVFDQYPVKDYWMLATPDSTSEYGMEDFVLCVSPSGFIYYNDFNYCGVRPFCIFNSSISVSCEE